MEADEITENGIFHSPCITPIDFEYGPQLNKKLKQSKKTTNNHKLDKIQLRSDTCLKNFFQDFESLEEKQQNSTTCFDIKSSSFRQQYQKYIEKISKITIQERINQAIFHLEQAVFLRETRFDFEIHNRKLIRAAYFLQTSTVFSAFMILCCLTYMIIPFIHQFYTYDSLSKNPFFILEVIILTMIAFEQFLILVHSNMTKYLRHQKIFEFWFVAKIIFLMCFIADLIYSITKPYLMIGWSIFLRGFLCFFYSYHLQKSFKSIIKASKQIFTVLLFMLVIIMFEALILNQIVQINSDIEFPADLDMKQYSVCAKIIYLFLTGDGIQILQPLLNQSYIWLVYYFIFSYLNILVITFIPAIYIFQIFRKFRGNEELAQQMIQKESLLLSFSCLDFKSEMHISQIAFFQFMLKYFKNQEPYIKNIKTIYIKINPNDQPYLSLDQFYKLCEVLNSNKCYSRPLIKQMLLWKKFRGFINKKIKLKEIVTSPYFEVFSLSFMVLNIILTFIEMFTQDENLAETIDRFTQYFLILVVLEHLSKIIGIGLYKYLDSKWNIYQLIIIICAGIADIIADFIALGNGVRTLKIAKLFKLLSKLSKLVRILRIIKSIEYIQYLQYGITFFQELNSLFMRIFVVIPILLQHLILLITILYFYTTLGYYLYGDYQTNQVLNFSTVANSLLSLQQIFLSQEMTSIVLAYFRLSNYSNSTLVFFISFHILMNYVMLAIIKGIIWQVFMIINLQIKKSEKQIEDNELKKNQSQAERKMKKQNNFKEKMKTHYMAEHKNTPQSPVKQKQSSCKDVMFKPNPRLSISNKLENLKKRQRCSRRRSGILKSNIKSNFLRNLSIVKKVRKQTFFSNRFIKKNTMTVNEQILLEDQILKIYKQLQIKYPLIVDHFENQKEVIYKNHTHEEKKKLFKSYQKRKYKFISNEFYQNPNMVLKKMYIDQLQPEASEQMYSKHFKFTKINDKYKIFDFSNQIKITQKTSFLYYELLRIIKNPHIENNFLFQLICQIENKFTELLPKGSYMKFTYGLNSPMLEKSNPNKYWSYFKINNKNKKILQEIKNIDWIPKKISQKENEIVYTSRDVFQSQSNANLKSINKIYSQFKKISHSVKTSKFELFNQKIYPFNFFCIQGDNDRNKKMSFDNHPKKSTFLDLANQKNKIMLDRIEQENKTDSQNDDEDIKDHSSNWKVIKRLLVFVLYRENTESCSQIQQVQEQSWNEQNTIQKDMSIQMHEVQEFLYFMNEIIKDSHFHQRLQNCINLQNVLELHNYLKANEFINI